MAHENSLYDLLKLTVERKASDLHLKIGTPPAIRIDGTVTPVEEFRFSRRDFDRLLETLLSADQRAQFQQSMELDFAYALEGIARFRVNLYQDVYGVGAVFRVIPRDVLNFEDVGLPPAAQKLIEQPNGLILVTGPTGAGKTTTLASYIQYVNQNARRHIVTIEDPIEYQFEEELSIVTQRQVGIDCLGFYEGLLTVLRQDPDIVVVGEMRDPKTIALTLNAAETGKLVLATLHTTSAVQTAERIVNVFPENQQRQVLHQLSMVLRGVVSQTLLPRIGGGRVAAFEVLINTSAVRAIIGDGKIHLLPSFLETGTEIGMTTLEMSMFQLVKRGLVRQEEAMSASPNPAAFKKLLQGARL
ncbi:MAG TPA: PilT/PilU family type 4a pilus ATPase [Candidatus Ozemobacteraceae bacterium]|nr:PilT/PilU family type 4a pilus ATPase [Candidatus Ozemobacteraceae bacterium]